MNIVTKIHILETGSSERVASFTLEDGWKGLNGSWREIPLVTHPSDLDALLAYSEALAYDGHQVEVERTEEKDVEGRVY